MHYGVVDALWSKFCHNMKLILGWNHFCRPLDPSLDIWSNFVKRKKSIYLPFLRLFKKDATFFKSHPFLYHFQKMQRFLSGNFFILHLP